MGILFSKKFDPSTDLPDLTGKVVIVTGGNAGIGYSTIKHLARRGAKVYMASRSEQKITAALERLEKEGTGSGKVLSLKLDLGDPRMAKAAADKFLTLENRLDLLINNAAWLSGPCEKNMDGVVDSMMTNHISPFVFTQTLLPLLKKTASEPNSDVRIIILSSHAHRLISEEQGHFRNMDDINQDFSKTLIPKLTSYGYTKFANIVYTKELQRRLDVEGAPIIVTAVHPGSVNTFADRLPPPIRPVGTLIMRWFFAHPDEGAYTSVVAAASPDVGKRPDAYKGAYLEPVGKIFALGKVVRNPELGPELWTTTETFLATIGLTPDA